MSYKSYAAKEETLTLGNWTISVSHTVTGREPLARVLLGPGLRDSGARLYGEMAKLAIAENIDIVRFEWPAELGRNWWNTAYGQRLQILWALLDLIKDETEETVPIFVGGRSISAKLASELSDSRITGYIFMSFPLQLPILGLGIPLRHGVLKALRKSALFIQGGRDEMAPVPKVEKQIKTLNPYAYLMLIPEGDHNLQSNDAVQEAGGRSTDEIQEEIANIFFWFLSDVLNKREQN